MGKTFYNLSNEQLCDMMCGKPEDDSICGYCLHHRRFNEGWVCNNPDSDYYGDYTDYNDSCEDFENRSNS